MANHARERAELALRIRNLDRTLTTVLPAASGTVEVASTGMEPLDAALRGGLPRGELSAIAGPISSGRTTMLLQLLAAATGRGELTAVIDPCDRFDVASAVAAGVALDRLLWVRGHVPDRSGPAMRDAIERGLERGVKALNLVLQAGGFGVVAFDAADVAPQALKRLPFTTWLRVHRAIEGRDTVCVVLAAEPLARSAGGITLLLSGRPQWAGGASAGVGARSDGRGGSVAGRRLVRMDVTTRIVSPRRRVGGEVALDALATGT